MNQVYLALHSRLGCGRVARNIVQGDNGDGNYRLFMESKQPEKPSIHSSNRRILTSQQQGIDGGDFVVL